MCPHEQDLHLFELMEFKHMLHCLSFVVFLEFKFGFVALEFIGLEFALEFCAEFLVLEFLKSPAEFRKKISYTCLFSSLTSFLLEQFSTTYDGGRT